MFNIIILCEFKYLLWWKSSNVVCILHLCGVYTLTNYVQIAMAYILTSKLQCTKCLKRNLKPPPFPTVTNVTNPVNLGHSHHALWAFYHAVYHNDVWYYDDLSQLTFCDVLSISKDVDLKASVWLWDCEWEHAYYHFDASTCRSCIILSSFVSVSVSGSKLKHTVYGWIKPIYSTLPLCSFCYGRANLVRACWLEVRTHSLANFLFLKIQQFTHFPACIIEFPPLNYGSWNNLIFSWVINLIICSVNTIF